MLELMPNTPRSRRLYQTPSKRLLIFLCFVLGSFTVVLSFLPLLLRIVPFLAVCTFLWPNWSPDRSAHNSIHTDTHKKKKKSVSDTTIPPTSVSHSYGVAHACFCGRLTSPRLPFGHTDPIRFTLRMSRNAPHLEEPNTTNTNRVWCSVYVCMVQCVCMCVCMCWLLTVSRSEFDPITETDKKNNKIHPRPQSIKNTTR